MIAIVRTIARHLQQVYAIRDAALNDGDFLQDCLCNAAVQE